MARFRFLCRSDRSAKIRVRGRADDKGAARKRLILTMCAIKDVRVLNSWKEIANFFDVSVRTAQRWEKSSGLPVHRQDKGRPIAYIEELEQWQDERAGKESATTYRAPVWHLLAGSTLVILLAGFIWQASSGGGVPATITLEESSFVVWSEEGDRLWDYTLPEIVLLERYSFEAPLDAYLIADIDDNGETEVLFNFRTPVGSQSRSRLYCFSETGQLRWDLELGREREFKGRYFSNDYAGHFVRLVRDGTGRPYILTVAQHRYWYPCQIALLNPATGEVVEEYWHPGGISHLLLHDLDGDGTPEVILAGINNPGDGLGHASLLSLKIPFSDSPKNTDSPFAEFTGGREHSYLLFPRPDTSFVNGTLLLFSYLASPDAQTILARLRMSVDGGSLLYFLDNEFRLKEFGISDDVPSVHDRLWLRGLLRHRFDQAEKDCLAQTIRFSTAPDGNSPELDQHWLGCEFHAVEALQTP